MEVQGEVKVKAGKEAVWKALNDPDVLKKATPGCNSITETETDTYKADITIGIAAVRGSYEAEIKILDKDEPENYRLVMKANSPAGFIEGDARVELQSESDSVTIIKYDGTAQVGGLIAGVGQRILSGIGKMIVKDFFKKLAKEV
ncbi:carbon monoxide dehydrogenase subunit G [Paenibacillus forsythiae]|uniref:Carbon monoxide dehydrogenase subunit G n=1 Tax=Paenibacillus forsythiae TaxID=365616 RepID=A0ABU3HC62_9BACL|nr:carbon monoxide dehydrogenase subunit G [Paenibacillus forsythiae]MDT3428409.1 carbon monoxide dehydrogenase subunit G [Paenibacillus forsythiae]